MAACEQATEQVAEQATEPAVTAVVYEGARLIIGDGSSEPNALDVFDRNQNGRVARNHPQRIKATGGSHNCLFFDSLNYTKSVIWVNDLIANIKCHISPKP